MKQNIKIAISGKSGCGNTTVSNLVAKKLKLKLINYTFHNMAQEAGIDFDEFYKKAQLDSSYDIALDKKQIELANEGGCVLASRLSVWLLKDATLKVFLTATQEERAKRILKREGGEFLAQMEKTKNRDLKDHKRYLELYQIDNDKFDFVDLVINTNQLRPDAIANIIVEALKAIVKSKGC